MHCTNICPICLETAAKLNVKKVVQKGLIWFLTAMFHSKLYNSNFLAEIWSLLYSWKTWKTGAHNNKTQKVCTSTFNSLFTNSSLTYIKKWTWVDEGIKATPINLLEVFCLKGSLGPCRFQKLHQQANPFMIYCDF